ncbi:riboflavin biosynthesis protein RibF [Paenalkalicoccus suaedae]|uniref:Riboflavin biosynthesis protein n=1 Tax=Paenalkalicoccus suaedae TaxID=2592382 RepID=A0A859FEM6_9BACI|nr:riboflavin biosynthesis protein RibF [Paenalkalicoccus suaedae]QKS71391.1 riboflavin biosynthesis protein RibF [Paenalkalicoccus suaedae]
MQIIHLSHPIFKSDYPKMSMALGFFDGVHSGHKHVIQTAIDHANDHGLKSAVMTFDPHPKEVLRHGASVKYLTNLQDKCALIEELGVDYLFVVAFTKRFAELSPQQFIDQYIIDLNVSHVVAGFDYSYGRLGKGTMDSFSYHARGKVTHTTVTKFEADNEKVSSTRIRDALLKNDLEAANAYLGRHYSLLGTVVHGEKRGRTIGFPTANVEPSDSLLVPATGVYAVTIEIDGEILNGVCNIGYKPTFHEERPDAPAVEVHIFDFTGDIYDKDARVTFVASIRAEKKFDSLDALKEQINKDKQTAVEILST